jgi:hypothetical protein
MIDIATLSVVSAVCGKAIDAVLGDHAPKLLSTLVGGVLGNVADRVVCEKTPAFLRSLRTTDPVLNHDLERSTREAYLLATLELVRQSEVRARVGSAASTLRSGGVEETLAKLRKAIEADLKDVGNTLPEPVTDASLLLLDPHTAPARRMEEMRRNLRSNLEADTARWLGGGQLPEVVETLLAKGWTIDTKYQNNVPRDWYGLIALAFIEKLKRSERLSRVFEAKLLAEIAVKEPRAAAIGTFVGFTGELDKLTVPLQEIEDSLRVVLRDLGEIKGDVKEVREDVKDIKQIVSRRQRVRAGWVVAGLAVTACALLGWTWSRMPSEAERALWDSRKEGDCAVIRDYLGRFPKGAYAEEGSRRLASLKILEKETWIEQEMKLPYVLITDPKPFATEAAARADALQRAERDVGSLCQPFQREDRRLRTSEAVPEQWRCTSSGSGVRCGFEGSVLCRFEVKQVALEERCP